MRRIVALLGSLLLAACVAPPPAGPPPPPPVLAEDAATGFPVLLVGLPPPTPGEAAVARVAAWAQALAAERIHPLPGPAPEVAWDGSRAWLRRRLPAGAAAPEAAAAWVRALTGARPRASEEADARSRVDAALSAACLEPSVLAAAWLAGGPTWFRRPGSTPLGARGDAPLRVGTAGPEAAEVAARLPPPGPPSPSGSLPAAGTLVWLPAPGGLWLHLVHPLPAEADRAALGVAGALMAEALTPDPRLDWAAPRREVEAGLLGARPGSGWRPVRGPDRFELTLGPVAPGRLAETLAEVETALAALERDGGGEAAVARARAGAAASPEGRLARRLGGLSRLPGPDALARVTPDRVAAAVRAHLSRAWSGAVAGGGDAARRDARPGKGFPLGLTVRPAEPCGP